MFRRRARQARRARRARQELWRAQYALGQALDQVAVGHPLRDRAGAALAEGYLGQRIAAAEQTSPAVAPAALAQARRGLARARAGDVDAAQAAWRDAEQQLSRVTGRPAPSRAARGDQHG